MRTRLKLKPGQRGARKLQLWYGDRLICVRDRYDGKTGHRFKTIDLIVDEQAWLPRDQHDAVHNVSDVVADWCQDEVRVLLAIRPDGTVSAFRSSTP